MPKVKMHSRIDSRLQQLGIVLPAPSVPPAVYSPTHIGANVVTVSGQPPYRDGVPAYLGKVGRDLTLEEGIASARLSALNILSHLKDACDGDLDRVTGCVHMLVLVHAAPDFYDVHRVADGASEVFAEIFAPFPPPTRSSLGCVSLPMNIATEVEASFTFTR